MLKRILLPRISAVGPRLLQAFPGQLFVHLKGAGWRSSLYAVAPTRQLDLHASRSEQLWADWRAQYQASCSETAEDLQKITVHSSACGANQTTPLPGWFGFLGYGAGRALPTPKAHEPKTSFPLASLGFFPCIVCEHQDTLEVIYLARYEDIGHHVIKQLSASAPNTPLAEFSLVSNFQPDIDFAAYQAGYQQVIDYIHAGDIYQANYAQRFSACFQGNPWHAFAKIQSEMQSPFGGFVAHPAGSVLSFSPEQFVALNGRQIETSPIKGTRPRRSNPSDDIAEREALRTSTKDQAENLMIVDLLRNDLSRVATLGSVRVPELFAIHSFTHVHHMISRITAELREGLNAIDLLESCFPGGSITGAPKKRACEVIQEVEAAPRSAYCGSLLHIDILGRMQSNLLIRSLVAEQKVAEQKVAEQNRLYCWGGGGIVADSNCHDEYEETLHKVGRLMQLFSEDRAPKP
ncbi:similar to para-aminobenzoate synthase component I [gamma proteobacterium HdN1]|nr:similar to para-aminobenzoate synthase component I [gamma proteobacterium HdN1]